MSRADRQQQRRKTQEASNDVLDSFEAAWFIGAHVETLRRLARRGEVPAYKVGKDWRFRRTALEAWCDSHQLRHRPPSVLVGDGEKSVRDTIRAFLTAHGYRVRGASTGREAIRSVRNDMPDVVLLDLVLPRMSGVEVLKELHAMAPEVPVVIMTGPSESELMRQAFSCPPVILLAKPIEETVLLRTVHRVLHGTANRRGKSG